MELGKKCLNKEHVEGQARELEFDVINLCPPPKTNKPKTKPSKKKAQTCIRSGGRGVVVVNSVTPFFPRMSLFVFYCLARKNLKAQYIIYSLFHFKFRFLEDIATKIFYYLLYKDLQKPLSWVGDEQQPYISSCS